jgi:uncharacterized integral membrane protein
MKLFKLIITLLILCFIGLFVFQNMETWKQSVSFKLNLYFNEGHDTQSIEQYIVILLSALIGFIIGLALLVKPHIKTRRLLKRERQEKQTLHEQVAMSGAAETSPEAAATNIEPSPSGEKEG